MVEIKKDVPQRWSVIRCDRRTLKFLEANKIVSEVFRPTVLNDKGRDVGVFFDYVFVCDLNFQKIEDFQYWINWVGYVTEEEMATIIKRKESFQQVTIKPLCGATVEIVVGPFQGFTGKVEREFGDRCVVSIPIFGRRVDVTISRDEVKRID